MDDIQLAELCNALSANVQRVHIARTRRLSLSSTTSGPANHAWNLREALMEAVVVGRRKPCRHKEPDNRVKPNGVFNVLPSTGLGGGTE